MTGIALNENTVAKIGGYVRNAALLLCVAARFLHTRCAISIKRFNDAVRL
jgi:hypothetical protein